MVPIASRRPGTPSRHHEARSAWRRELGRTPQSHSELSHQNAQESDCDAVGQVRAGWIELNVVAVAERDRNGPEDRSAERVRPEAEPVGPHVIRAPPGMSSASTRTTSSAIRCAVILRCLIDGSEVVSTTVHRSPDDVGDLGAEVEASRSGGTTAARLGTRYCPLPPTGRANRWRGSRTPEAGTAICTHNAATANPRPSA